MRKIRTFYTEDHDLVRFTANQLLDAEGWEAEVCRNGRTALKKLKGDEHFDLLILDDRLGVAYGGELIERARRNDRLRFTPIVMFSASHADGKSCPQKANAYLSKPALKDLVATCRRLLPRAAEQSEFGEPPEMPIEAAN